MTNIIIESESDLYPAIWEIIDSFVDIYDDSHTSKLGYETIMNQLNINQIINKFGFYQFVINEIHLSYLMLKYSEIFLKWKSL